jgi:hypothetical protein
MCGGRAEERRGRERRRTLLCLHEMPGQGWVLSRTSGAGLLTFVYAPAWWEGLLWMNLTKSDRKREPATIKLKKEMAKVNVPREKMLGTSPWPAKQTEMSTGTRESEDRREGSQNHSRL